jgi:hypothetical protein
MPIVPEIVLDPPPKYCECGDWIEHKEERTRIRKCKVWLRFGPCVFGWMPVDMAYRWEQGYHVKLYRTTHYECYSVNGAKCPEPSSKTELEKEWDEWDGRISRTDLPEGGWGDDIYPFNHHTLYSATRVKPIVIDCSTIVAGGVTGDGLKELTAWILNSTGAKSLDGDAQLAGAQVDGGTLSLIDIAEMFAGVSDADKVSGRNPAWKK